MDCRSQTQTMADLSRPLKVFFFSELRLRDFSLFSRSTPMLPVIKNIRLLRTMTRFNLDRSFIRPDARYTEEDTRGFFDKK